jgi:hypothetical protein
MVRILGKNRVPFIKWSRPTDSNKDRM